MRAAGGARLGAGALQPQCARRAPARLCPQDQMEGMRKKEEHLEKDVLELSTQNRRLAEPLQKAQDEMHEMQKQLRHHERDKQILAVSLHQSPSRPAGLCHLCLRVSPVPSQEHATLSPECSVSPTPHFSPEHKSTFESHRQGAQGPTVGARGAGAALQSGEPPAGGAPSGEAGLWGSGG